jgi:hypothetical protein
MGCYRVYRNKEGFFLFDLDLGKMDVMYSMVSYSPRALYRQLGLGFYRIRPSRLRYKSMTVSLSRHLALHVHHLDAWLGLWVGPPRMCASAPGMRPWMFQEPPPFDFVLWLASLGLPVGYSLITSEKKNTYIWKFSSKIKVERLPYLTLVWAPPICFEP